MKIKIKNKIGLSSVVSTLIITALSIVALSLTFATVSNILNSAKYSPTLTCSDIQIENPVEIISACKKTDSNLLEIQTRRTFSSIEFEEIQFEIISTTSSLKYNCGGPSCGCIIPSQGEIKNYDFELNENSQVQKVILKVNDCVLTQKEITSC